MPTTRPKIGNPEHKVGDQVGKLGHTMGNIGHNRIVENRRPIFGNIRPKVSFPAAIRPKVSLHAAVRSKEAVPAADRPKEAAPAAIRPKEAAPAATRPKEAVPADIRPKISPPAGIRPNETVPAAGIRLPRIGERAYNSVMERKRLETDATEREFKAYLSKGPPKYWPPLSPKIAADLSALYPPSPGEEVPNEDTILRPNDKDYQPMDLADYCATFTYVDRFKPFEEYMEERDRVFPRRTAKMLQLWDVEAPNTSAVVRQAAPALIPWPPKNPNYLKKS